MGKMHWQKTGDYLCVKVDRYSKLRKEKEETKYAGLYCNFEVFHMREKQIPVDSVEIKDNVQAFAWEPVGSKFAIIHGESQSMNVSFDTADFTSMNSGEHFMATDIEWDPTGRYIMTAVSWWGHKVDNAYFIWSFQGKLLKRFQLDRFCQFSWRPRPPCFLSNKQIREIKKNLKKYSVEFDVVDKMKISEISKELLEKRQAARKISTITEKSEWMKWLHKKNNVWHLEMELILMVIKLMIKSWKKRLWSFWSVKKSRQLIETIRNYLKYMIIYMILH